jgi:hypothetical protein
VRQRGNDPGNIDGIEQAALPRGAIEQHVMRQLLEIVAQPTLQRQGEAALPAAQNRLGNEIGGRAAQQVLATDAHQHVGRKAGGEFDDLGVEVRAAHLERVGHRRDVDLDVDVVGQVRLEIEVGEAADRGSGSALAQHPLEALDRGRRRGGLHARQVELRLVLGREMPDERRVPRRFAARKRHGVARGGTRRKVQRPDQRGPVDGPRDGREGVVEVTQSSRPVPLVAREHLVGGVAGKRHRHVLLRHPGEVKHRDGGTVGERLAVMPHDGVDHVGHRGIDDHFVMIGGVACGDQAGILELAVVGVGESDREGLHACRRLRGHQRHDRRAVDASGKERAERNVRHQPAPDGVGEQGRQLVRELARRPAGGAGGGFAPIALDPGRATRRKQRAVRRRQLRDADIGRPRRGHVLQREKLVDGAVIDFRRGFGKSAQQRMHFGSEGEAVLQAAIEQRLLPGAVAGEQQPVLARIEERKGEHSGQAAHAIAPVLLVEVEDHLAVAPRAERVTPGEKLPPELGEVVDLPVRHQRHAAVLVAHRLPGVGGKVDDRKPAMPERARAVLPYAIRIRAAVAHGVVHAPNGPHIRRRAGVVRQKAANSTHWVRETCLQCSRGRTVRASPRRLLRATVL